MAHAHQTRRRGRSSSPARTRARPARSCASTRRSDRVYVEGLNMVKRHQRPRPVGPQRAAVGVIEKEGPIHVSNVMIVDPKDKKPTRVGIDARRAGRAHARHQALRGGARLTWHDSRTRYPTEIRPALIEQLRLHDADAGARGSRRSRSTWASARPSRTRRCSTRRTEQLATIAGQKPNVRRARKSIAAFKLREGMPVGVTVTLRGERAYEFLDRLIVDRDPAHPRLPRPEPALVRRPRQLLDGRPRADHLPRDRLRRDRPGPRASTSRSPRPRRPTTRRSRCSRRSACRSRATARPAGFESLDPSPPPPREEDRWPRHPRSCASRATAEVQDAGHYALPPLRPPARRLPQVRPLPHLPARARAQRLHPRHDEVELVAAMSMTDPIADFLTRIRNGIRPRTRRSRSRPRRLKREMARILNEQGYIEGFESTPGVPGEAARQDRRAAQVHRRPHVGDLRPAARLAPGQRTYVDAEAHPEGPAAAWAPRSCPPRTGVMTGHDARKQGVGGEVVARGLVATCPASARSPSPSPTASPSTIEPERRARRRARGRSRRSARSARHRGHAGGRRAPRHAPDRPRASTAPCTGSRARWSPTWSRASPTASTKRLEIQGVGYRAELKGRTSSSRSATRTPCRSRRPRASSSRCPQPTRVDRQGHLQAAGRRDRRRHPQAASAGALQGQGHPLRGRVRRPEGR